MMKNWMAALAIAAAGTALAQTAPVKVEGAWARASVQGQSGTGAFMRITASEPVTLVGVSTPAAGVAEVHEMKMEGDVMRMRAAGPLALAPGKTLELKPGGYHVMLMQLRTPLKPGTQLPLALLFKDAKGAERRVDLSLPISATAPVGETHKH